MDDRLRNFLLVGEQAGARYSLALPRSVPLGLSGGRLSPRAGSSLEFKEHREYQPGDDLRRIDWSAYARCDRLHIKLYREEVSPHLDILLDGSKSIDLPETAKGGAAVALTAALAAAADNAHCTVGVYLAGAGCRRVEPAGVRPSMWSGIDFTHAGPLNESIAQSPPAFGAHSIRVLIGDLLWVADPLAILQLIAQRAAAVVVVQVLARADVDPPQRGNMRLVDSETAQVHEVFIDAAAQQRYRAALARHQENWHRAARQVGAAMATLVAEDLLDGWDLQKLVELEVIHVQ